MVRRFFISLGFHTLVLGVGLHMNGVPDHAANVRFAAFAAAPSGRRVVAVVGVKPVVEARRRLGLPAAVLG